MTIQYAIASGNWSATSTWYGGVLPTVGQDVYSNGYTVTIDQSVNVASLQNLATTGVTAGGGFTVSTNGLTITCTGAGIVDNSTVTTCLTINVASPNSINVVANSTTNGGGGAGNYGTNITGNGTVNWTGNATGGVGYATCYGINVQAGTLNFTGTPTGGGSTGGNYVSAGIVVASGAILNVAGNPIGGNSGSEGYGISNAGVTNITGSVSGGAGTQAAGVQNSGTCTVSGTVAAAGNVPGIINSGTLTVAGTVTASSGSVGINNSGLVIQNGNDVSSSTGYPGIGGTGKILRSTTANLSDAYAGNLGGSPSGTVTLSTGGVGTIPAVGNVRSGTSYGTAASPVTGTLAVPSPSVVLLGNATDNTTGTLSPLHPELLLSTTIATVTNQTTFILATGSPVASYTDQTVILTNHSNTLETFAASVSSWTGGSLTLVVANAAPWTVTASDTVQIVVAGSNVATDSSGRVLLQPAQTGVTIPTVTNLVQWAGQNIQIGADNLPKVSVWSFMGILINGTAAYVSAAWWRCSISRVPI